MAEEGTFCIREDVVKKSGANASATSSAEAYTNIFIQEVEGRIMCTCRYDFKTNYATLNAELKELLRLATSALAAIHVINYDMSGFSSRIEAELMVNILKTVGDESIELLSDQKTVTYGV